MRKKRNEQGGTLALVVALIIVLVLVGIMFVLWQFLIGGGNQVRNLTDSGVLNVAKQALNNPSLLIPANRNIGGVNVTVEFGDLLDNAGGGNFRLTLQNYNRLVGRVVLAQLNAQSAGGRADNPNSARDNARALTNAVNVLGSELAARLNNFDNLRGNFEAVARQGNVNKLQGKGANSDVDITARNEHAVAFAARPEGNVRNASNVFINPSQIPPGINNFISTNTVTKRVNGADRTFLVGYAPLSSATGIGAQVTYCVPLRPGEQPHSLALDDFTAATAPPAGLSGGSITQVIPNAFRGGSEVSNTLIGGNSQHRSCAVVGLPQVFSVEQPGGTIIVDNAGVNAVSSPTGDRQAPGFSDVLMEPNGFEIFNVTTVPPCRFSDGSTRRRYYAPAKKTDPPPALPSGQVKAAGTNFAPLNPEGPGTSLPPIFDKIMRLGGTMTGEDAFIMLQTVRYKSRIPSRNVNMQPPAGLSDGELVPPGNLPVRNIQNPGIICSTADFAGPPCSADAAALLAAANGQIVGANGQVADNLMILEQYILAVRGAFSGAGSGCVVVPQYGIPGTNCVAPNGQFIGSGLKDIPDTATTTPPPFPNSNPTLRQLLADTNINVDEIRADLQARANQIGGATGNVTADDILNAVIPFNSIRYIVKNPNGPGVVVTEVPPPSLTYRGPGGLQYAQQNPQLRPQIDPNLNVPDGPTIQRERFLNLSADGGPGFIPFFMWECGSGQSSGVSRSAGRYIRSEGRGGLLGIFRFVNCPQANGPDWCCP